MPIDWNRRKYSKQNFIDAWTSSPSIAQVAKKLDLSIYGSTYQTLKNTATELGLTMDHMTGQGHLLGKSNPWTPRRPNHEVFVLGKKENSGTLKNRLIKDFGWEYRCNRCGIDSWFEENISLELEHKNGNNLDNRIENLELLCPNCHSLTPTWRGRNISGRLDKSEKSASSKVASKEGNLDAGSNPAPPTCCKCGATLKTKRAKICQICHKRGMEKISWPTTEELLEMLANSNYTKLSIQLGVSDNAIRHRIKTHPPSASTK